MPISTSNVHGNRAFAKADVHQVMLKNYPLQVQTVCDNEWQQKERISLFSQLICTAPDGNLEGINSNAYLLKSSGYENDCYTT
ncbi:hypothetical protein LOAG_15066 [Loa loa]|uniref:Uncharacterized protein n=1 Tax=Loa loa TaxID=7209 RepID=A0A1S0THU6_LOALO|nr:hypothetical protein LOAG_15066 [Loa loa]EFO13464.2 hypothetical protein LOAG_15066 [Loa loa]